MNRFNSSNEILFLTISVRFILLSDLASGDFSEHLLYLATNGTPFRLQEFLLIFWGTVPYCLIPGSQYSTTSSVYSDTQVSANTLGTLTHVGSLRLAFPMFARLQRPVASGLCAAQSLKAACLCTCFSICAKDRMEKRNAMMRR